MSIFFLDTSSHRDGGIVCVLPFIYIWAAAAVVVVVVVVVQIHTTYYSKQYVYPKANVHFFS